MSATRSATSCIAGLPMPAEAAVPLAGIRKRLRQMGAVARIMSPKDLGGVGASATVLEVDA
jgi:hypothetical protein